MTSLIAEGAELEKLYTGTTWAEGPVWLPDLQRVRWSDVVGNRILEFDARTGVTAVYGEDVEYTNGRALDHAGNVVQCSHGRRRVERDAAGTVAGIVDSFEGRRLNSPNDVVVASDGAIWFTDPPYGILPEGREGHPGEEEYGGCFVFRFDEASGTLAAVITDLVHPNGLVFSPDESVLYVSDTGVQQNGEHRGEPGGIRVYDVRHDGADTTVAGGRDFALVRPGVADGMRVDVDGRLWSSSGDSVQVFESSGERVAVIPVPEVVANLCFGGEDGHDLYVTATTSLYRIRTTTTAAAHR